MTTTRLPILMAALAVAWLAAPSLALDPPHDMSRSIECSSCHTGHTAPGATLTRVAGNANLCMSCHVVGGPATSKPFSPADQARPAPGLPAGAAPGGTSHRWDSGPAGRVQTGAGNTSQGRVSSRGAFTGPFAKTYTITITTDGPVGTARFSWSATTPGGGSGTDLPTGAEVALDQGVVASFTDGSSGTSFVAGDVWQILVRPDLALPLTPALAVRLEDGKLMCSTCHDQHSQKAQPFDPAAPAFGGPGTGAGRHFQRAANDANQMCLDCHRARDVTQASQGSHPVQVTIPAGGAFKAPGTLPLGTGGRVLCMSCHAVHGTPSSDGSLSRMANPTNLCGDCHTLADLGTPAEHFKPTASTLWPGGQYGSTFPAVTAATRQGACTNCHQPHGWPDTADTTHDYPHLLVDREESLCTTCHDGSPVAANIRAELSKATSHPVIASSGDHSTTEPAVVALRHVECEDCHNPHQAKARVSLPGPSTSPRPASGPLAGARGVDAAGTPLATAAFEYQVCLRCHGDSPGKPAAPTTRQFPETNVRLEFGGTFASFHPVMVAGKNPDVPSLIGGYSTSSILSCTSCHNNNTGPAAGGTGPNGPHGSANPRLLEGRYITADNTPFVEGNFALCFKCHSWDNLRSDTSFKEHDKHIRGEDTPCNVCHDPHASQGQPKLINFDTSVVRPLNGVLEFRSTGRFQGECTLACHGQNHDRFNY